VSCYLLRKLGYGIISNSLQIYTSLSLSIEAHNTSRIHIIAINHHVFCSSQNHRSLDRLGKHELFLFRAQLMPLLPGQDGLNSLEFNPQASLPQLSDYEVLVKFHAASPNYRDLVIPKGTFLPVEPNPSSQLTKQANTHSPTKKSSSLARRSRRSDSHRFQSHTFPTGTSLRRAPNRQLQLQLLSSPIRTNSSPGRQGCNTLQPNPPG
jgi:hypothetical protein